MRKIFILILVLIISLSAKTQNLSNLRTKSFSTFTDTLQLDTLSIVPGSEIIFDENNSIISKSEYTIDYTKANINLLSIRLTENSTIYVSYRVFPVNFTEPYFNRNKEEIVIVGPVLTRATTNQAGIQNNFFSSNQINKQGSIARGITIGNNQDAVINSNLNFQMSGKIGDDMHILAAISDENIPIQPDGNSQQIQDFDKVFIQLYNEKTKLIAGDFEIYKPSGYFMNINKKAQGGLLTTTIKSKKNKSNSVSTTISGAVTKGKYCRKTYNGQEGNQGPYKLTGCENEQYIIIFAGTEKVYVNGKIQTRGKEYDYIIDYNTGEITFTANRPITKDSRIAIEFEYSERSFARFMIYSANDIKTKNGNFWVNIYSEQDSKNQEINQDLTDEQKRLLSVSGDDIENAFVPNVDSVEFRNDYVLYAKKDTLINTTNYTIYEYSIDPALAIYQLGFSLVGDNKGNYVQIQNSANGKVFEWIAPITGVPQGNYAPVRLLIAPKKQQMLSVGGNLKLNKNTQTNFEFALSNYDLNTFSTVDAGDNNGYALKIGIQKNILKKDTVKNSLKSTIAYQIINKNFIPIERFRSVEFERDWNLQAPLMQDEHFANINLLYRYKRSLQSNYGFEILTSDNEYTGYKHLFNTSATKLGYSLNFNSSLLNTNSTQKNTQFIRYLADLNKSFKTFKVGFENELEQNIWKNNNTDSLINNSFSFSSYRFYIENPDSTINNYSISYKLRDDFIPIQNNLKQSSRSEDIQVGFGLLKNPSSILKAIFTYRNLEIKDTSLIQQKEENTITGRINYNLRLFKGTISSLTFYEAGSGLEPTREFSYIKVSAGQGIYNWVDYNSNGIAELDEFEIAQFQDQANYIRIYTPGTEYIKTYKNEFSQVINIRPEAVWKSKKGIRKVLSRFSNSLAYQVNQKSTDENLTHSLNPFYSTSNDSSIISLNESVRNTLSFNRSGFKFGVDYIFKQNTNKILLSNGFDEREKLLNGIRLRWRFIEDVNLQNYFELGDKKNSSEFFSSKNYNIKNISNEIKIQYQPGFQTKIELKYLYTDKKNTLSQEKSFSHNIGGEINYSVTKKSNLLAKGDYFDINYNADPNTSIAYEMLQGLKPGNNATWSLMFQKKLAQYLELNIFYNGRVSENIKTIHTGSLQLRAFF
ncbi:MAG: hypothetical protein PF485_01645 [Bacteroidales bacterium]|nr:hypothetical protein [Bacteroidales bacterium]